VTALAVGLLGGCARDAGPATTRAPRGESTLVLYVSNQSFSDDPVEIRVMIDQDLVVDDDFLVEGQHNWVEYELPLPEGHSKLIATSGTGVVHEVDLDMPADGTRWAVLDYWYAPEAQREFTFTIHDEPVTFD
jgi:hypothetical protein